MAIENDKLLKLGGAQLLYDNLRESVDGAIYTITNINDTKANKKDTILASTLSRGRNGESTTGKGSFAFGQQVSASGAFSHAEGAYTTAEGADSHAEGNATYAKGFASHAEGVQTESNYLCHAEGSYTLADGNNSHAEGYNTKAYGSTSHAEGAGTQTNGYVAHVEGFSSQANGDYSHAEGNDTKSIGNSSHAQNNKTNATGENSHAEGYQTQAIGKNSHAEGNNTIANGEGQHVSGQYNIPDNYDNWPAFKTGTYYHVGDKVKVTTSLSNNQTTVKGYICKYDHLATNQAANMHPNNWTTDTKMTYAEIVGNGTSQVRKNIRTLDWDGNEAITGSMTVGSRDSSYTMGEKSFASGSGVVASGLYSHAEGYNTQAVYNYAHAEGNTTQAITSSSHAEGDNTIAQGLVSHAEGIQTQATGNYAHSEGSSTLASGANSHAENSNTQATGENSHAEGNTTQATGAASHAEGNSTQATGESSHAEGDHNQATGEKSHAEGCQTIAKGNYSHAEGYYTEANGNCSHAEGYRTKANGTYSHVSGTRNIPDSYNNWPLWSANTKYEIYDHVKRLETKNGESVYCGYICKNSNQDATFTSSHWWADSNHMNFVEIIGNGDGADSNARALTWKGDEIIDRSLSIGGYGFSAPPDYCGQYTITTGVGSRALGQGSQAFGLYSIANGAYSHVIGSSNIEDSYDNWATWTANTSYSVGDKVKRSRTKQNQTIWTGYICLEDNQDAEFTVSKWEQVERMNYIEIVGNGKNYLNRSNARTLDWDGNEWLAGSLSINGTSLTIGKGTADEVTITATQLKALLALLNT